MWKSIGSLHNPNMRFNEKEIKTLAAQHKCEKEGNLFFRERQEGFFRKAEGDDCKTFMNFCFPSQYSPNLLKRTIFAGMKWQGLVECLYLQLPNHHVCFLQSHRYLSAVLTKDMTITNLIWGHISRDTRW